MHSGQSSDEGRSAQGMLPGALNAVGVADVVEKNGALMESWQEILRDTFLHRRKHLHGPLYWTGWLIVKAVSRGKYPNESQPADVLMTLIGMTIWLGPLVALAVYNNL